MTDNILSELLSELQSKYSNDSEYTLFFALCDEVFIDNDASMSHDDIIKTNAVFIPRENIYNELRNDSDVDLPQSVSDEIVRIFDDHYDIHLKAFINNESKVYEKYCNALHDALMKNLQPTFDQTTIQHLCKKWLNPTILYDTIDRAFDEHSFRSDMIKQLHQWLIYIRDHPDVKISIGTDHKYYGLVMHFDHIFDFGQ